MLFFASQVQLKLRFRTKKLNRFSIHRATGTSDQRDSLYGLESPYANELHILLNKREIFMSALPL